MNKGYLTASIKHSFRVTPLPFIISCMAIGFLSSFLGGAFKRQPWYDDTPKPTIWPSQWVFPVVWTGNYTLLGLAVWKVWQKGEVTSIQVPLRLFALHLLHNFSFIPIVYHIKKKSTYVIMDTISLVLGVITTLSFVRVSRSATFFMLPYLGWLCFTTTIKVLWWQMNVKHKEQ